MRTGWPFLVARGRTRDYRTVLVPELLAGRGQQALLADALAIPDPESGVQTITLRPRGSEPLLITARAEVLTSATVGAAGADPRDEHGRPLEFLYGVVQLPPAAAPDLDTAREQALASYRRFLADEDGFTFEVAPALGDAATIEVATIEEPPRPMALATASATPAPDQPTRRLPQPPQPPPPPGRLRLVAVAAAVVVAVVVVIVAWPQRAATPITALDLTACTDQAGSRLLGSITLDDATDVRFVLREGGSEQTTSARRYSAGTHVIEIPVQLTGSTVQVSAEVSGRDPVHRTAPRRC